MIQVVGIGPGRREGRTIAADDALRRAEVIVGYTTYVELVRDEFAEKRFVTTGMRGEKERCVQALLLSREGRRVALICSGDAQVYGMASLLLGMAEEGDEIEVVPGVTAALSAAAVLVAYEGFFMEGVSQNPGRTLGVQYCRAFTRHSMCIFTQNLSVRLYTTPFAETVGRCNLTIGMPCGQKVTVRSMNHYRARHLPIVY